MVRCTVYPLLSVLCLFFTLLLAGCVKHNLPVVNLQFLMGWGQFLCFCLPCSCTDYNKIWHGEGHHRRFDFKKFCFINPKSYTSEALETGPNLDKGDKWAS